MPVCPGCKTTQTRRISGACPNCGQPVQITAGGRWFRTGEGSPTQALLHHFEKVVSDSLSTGRTTRVPFYIPKKGARYPLELATAERYLEECDGDLDIAKEVITTLVTDKRFAWKTRTSLMNLHRDLPVGLALVRAKHAEEEALRKKESTTIRKTIQQENIFQ